MKETVSQVEPFNEFVHRCRGIYLSQLPRANVIFSAACAGAWYFDWFSERYPHSPQRHIGVELCPAPAGLPDTVQWIQGDIRDLSIIPTDSVDLTFAGQVIEHLDADAFCEFLCEVNRVTKVGGVDYARKLTHFTPEG